MIFTNEQYEEKKNYLEGLFSLGGMSECGKTSAGLYFDSIGIKRMKIIHIEKEMMAERGFDTSCGYEDHHFDNLYAGAEELAFKEFLYRLIIKLQQENCKFASIESLYRAPLGKFLKKELGDKMINLYIEAPIEIRVKREMSKINTKRDNSTLVTFDEVFKMVSDKDDFKHRRGAHHVRDIADIIVNNGENVSYNGFLKMINGIGHVLIK